MSMAGMKVQLKWGLNVRKLPVFLHNVYLKVIYYLYSTDWGKVSYIITTSPPR